MSIYKPGRPNKYDPSTGRGAKPPSCPGEYRLRDSTGILCYIGETCNLNRRTKEHIRSGNSLMAEPWSTKLPMGVPPQPHAESTNV